MWKCISLDALHTSYLGPIFLLPVVLYVQEMSVISSISIVKRQVAVCHLAFGGTRESDLYRNPPCFGGDLKPPCLPVPSGFKWKPLNNGFSLPPQNQSWRTSSSSKWSYQNSCRLFNLRETLMTLATFHSWNVASCGIWHNLWLVLLCQAWKFVVVFWFCVLRIINISNKNAKSKIWLKKNTLIINSMLFRQVGTNVLLYYLHKKKSFI